MATPVDKLIGESTSRVTSIHKHLPTLSSNKNVGCKNDAVLPSPSTVDVTQNEDKSDDKKGNDSGDDDKKGDDSRDDDSFHEKLTTVISPMVPVILPKTKTSSYKSIHVCNSHLLNIPDKKSEILRVVSCGQTTAISTKLQEATNQLNRDNQLSENEDVGRPRPNSDHIVKIIDEFPKDENEDVTPTKLKFKRSYSQTASYFTGSRVPSSDIVIDLQNNFDDITEGNEENPHMFCGTVQFNRVKDVFHAESKKQCVCVQNENEVSKLSWFMSHNWGFRKPSIILSVISSEQDFKPWKNKKMKYDFQKGIIKLIYKTEIWLLTNGVDTGIPKVIGDAVREYRLQQLNVNMLNNLNYMSEEQQHRQPRVIGIVKTDHVAYWKYFETILQIQIKNLEAKIRWELNPDHSHFILIKSDNQVADDKEWCTKCMRCFIEYQFRNEIHHRKRQSLQHTYDEDDVDRTQIKHKVPVVGLLVQGSLGNVDHVLYYLVNHMPVVVLKGSGGLADLIGYMVQEYQEKVEKEDIGNFLKPGLMKMIHQQFSKQYANETEKNAFCDKIIKCVQIACQCEAEYSCLTIFNIKKSGANLQDLDRYLLKALIKSEKKEAFTLQDQLLNDLRLTIDWNRPDIAKEIMHQDSIKIRLDKKIFEKALLKDNRENFIDIFLDDGVKVHKYLSHVKLKQLFERAENREFFVKVCLGGILGISILPHEQLESVFRLQWINRLIYKLTLLNDFVQENDLTSNSMGSYATDEIEAENIAINCLIIWAVLMNRHKMAVMLWSKCAEPIGMALICCQINKGLAKLKMEQYQRTELMKNSTDFGEMALGALAICWRDSSCQAYHMLSKRISYFNNKTTLEIAHEARYIHFLAHPCCQKWLTKMFFGSLQLKDVHCGRGSLRLPNWFKLLASAFLIFPMYMWITFIPPSKDKDFVDADVEYGTFYDSDDSDEEENCIKSHLNVSASETNVKKKWSSVTGIFANILKWEVPQKDIPLTTKIYLTWTAPITKFWITQMFYFAFLAVFAVATVWPTCGNLTLDLIIWLWASVIEAELICRIVIKSRKHKTLSLWSQYVDSSIIMAFLIAIFVLRIVPSWFNVSDYMLARTFMCLALIYFFYRLVGVYFPISSTLGPMLLRIKRMVKLDFVIWIRMFLIFMIAGGVTVQSILYPNFPMGSDLLKRVLLRPLYAIFMTKVDDVDGDSTCSYKYSGTENYCKTKSHDKGILIKSLEHCPHSSFSGYIIFLQYLLICKLVLTTLLFAMFSHTIGKVNQTSSESWKFQRYALIVDFSERFTLPPPITVISFLYLLLISLAKKMTRCQKTCQNRCCKEVETKSVQYQKSCIKKSQENSAFWTKVAREYISSLEVKEEKGSIVTKHHNLLVNLSEDLKLYHKTVKYLGNRVVELERMLNTHFLSDQENKELKVDSSTSTANEEA